MRFVDLNTYKKLIYFCIVMSFLLGARTTLSAGFIVTVYAYDNKETLPGVSVINFVKRYSQVTDINGRVEIYKLRLKDTVSFSYLGYEEENFSVKDLMQRGGKVYMKMKSFDQSEIVVKGANKFQERINNIPTIIDILSSKDLRLINSQTSADMLLSTGNVFVQKSQMGGGSPIIRGFEANKILMVVDGVRMNNAIYRNGHLQNVITIDNSILERTEVIYGPASVIYGSDALGGVINFFTKRPKLAFKKKTELGTNAYLRYSSANNEKTAHVDFNFGRRKWASLTSITASDYGDLRAGSTGMSDFPDFGRRNFYVDHINGQDSVVANKNPLRQIGTGYSQLDILQKILYQQSQNFNLIFNFQYSTSSDVPRYDQLTDSELIDLGDGTFREDFKFAEWRYGPQNRLLASVQANYEKEEGFFHKMNLVAAYQRIGEDRISRRFGRGARQYQEEDVDVWSLNADFMKSLEPNDNGKNSRQLQYGIELTHNKVNSNAFSEDIATGEINQNEITRYPDGGSTMSSFAAYLNFRQRLLDKVNVIAGLRYTYTSLLSRFDDTTTIQLPYSEISSNISALTGSFGATWKLGKDWFVNGLLSTSFRSPNIDDFGKIRAKGDDVTIPNPNLQAEHGVNGELSMSKVFELKEKESIKVSGTYFYSFLFDALVREKTTLNGSEFLLYDGELLRTQWNANAGSAFIRGFSINAKYNYDKMWEVSGSFNSIRGRNTGGEEDSPLAHIPPIYGQVALKYTKDKIEFKFLSRYNGWKHIEDYELEGSDNEDKATPLGTPSWMTLNAYASYQLNKRYSVNLAVENMLDTHYRPFSSGVSASGINLILTLRGRF